MGKKSMQFKGGVIIAFGMILATFSYYFYQLFFTPNLQVDKDATYLYIPTGATFETVADSLDKKDILNDKMSFFFLSKLLKYRDNVKPGRYLISRDMKNLEALKMLKRGTQTPVKLTFNTIRLKADLANKLSAKIELSEQKLMAMLNNGSLAKQYGFNQETFMTMFIPDTYEVYWTISEEELLEKISKAYHLFWNKDRLAKAKALELSPAEVTILASIVEAETNKSDEKSRVAGVYINRLKVNMPLQADPTVKYAVGDFALKRIYKGHLALNSPYNTYMYAGLPPGPINLPSSTTIDAVLNYEKHNYIYFCAHHNLSGHHDFAATYAEHQKLAEKYRKALNKLNIK